ncbi:hypothetical protein NKH69_31580 [Mesorhizobium sp. M0976]|uniref:hypothetical protein n=1 Tax=Mesorhizobium sp. M0976 TaxID=2957038 RepID=UPI00333BE580
MSYPNLDQICAAIKADDAKYLYSLSLATRSRYQTVETRLADLNQRIVDTLARAFRGPLADCFPALAVSCRKCRVGSTALTKLFGIAGFPSSSRSRLSCGSRRLVNLARPGSCADHRKCRMRMPA